MSDLDLSQRDDLLPPRQGLALEPAPDEAGRDRWPWRKCFSERKLQASDYVFQSERAEKMSRSAFWRIVSQAGDRAGLPVKAYAHQLRHACGYYLANKGCDLRLIQDYLGHKQIQNTVRYTALNPARFAGLW